MFPPQWIHSRLSKVLGISEYELKEGMGWPKNAYELIAQTLSGPEVAQLRDENIFFPDSVRAQLNQIDSPGFNLRLSEAAYQLCEDQDCVSQILKFEEPLNEKNGERLEKLKNPWYWILRSQKDGGPYWKTDAAKRYTQWENHFLLSHGIPAR